MKMASDADTVNLHSLLCMTVNGSGICDVCHVISSIDSLETFVRVDVF